VKKLEIKAKFPPYREISRISA